jgi:hypothetical protein
MEELKEIVGGVETSNDPAFGAAGPRLHEALSALERTSRWLLEKLAAAPNDALAGATPYLRLFGVTLGGCSLAREALAVRASDDGDRNKRYTTLARFFAENISVQARALERAVIDGADAINGANAVLFE